MEINFAEYICFQLVNKRKEEDEFLDFNIKFLMSRQLSSPVEKELS